ncbi:DnaJ domain-containing protein [Myxococcota bacterium]|nr:DnaJ domain-containing protein [Myxococcota bacterium]
MLGEEVRFSDLFAAATLSGFTGGILVRAPKDAAVFFRGGVPFYAGGVAFDRHFLGEILVRRNLVTSAQLADALAEQASAPATARPLLGALLVARAGLDPSVIKEAVSQQIAARLLQLFTAVEGTWQSAPGENARIRDIGVPCAVKDLLLVGLLEHATDDELRHTSDIFLGKALRLKGEPPAFDYGPNEQKVIGYLAKPRKPDQLERAQGSRRPVRALLRLLWITNKLEVLPVAQAIPIPKATLLKGTQLPGVPETTPAVEVVAPPPKAERAAPSAPTQSDKNLSGLIADARAFHAELESKSYFELLGVPKDAPAADVKKAYHSLAKKFHPDALGGVITEEVAGLVRDIAAKLNEANQVLTNEKSRGEYVALLANDRIKGDARKAEKIRDAEVKYQMGVVMLKKRDYARARELFNFAVTNDPEEAEYKANLAWAMLADPKFDRAQALTDGWTLLQDALKVRRPSAQVFYYAGQFMKAKDQMKEALQYFRRAAELDPRNTDAAREARLIEMRQQKGDDDDSKNPLKRLFKR